MVDTLFQVLQFMTSTLVIVTLYLVTRSYKWWLGYAANSILFSVVSIYKDAPWFACMGVCLCATAIKNYRVEKRKETKDLK